MTATGLAPTLNARGVSAWDFRQPIAATLFKAGCSAAENWMFADPFTERLAYEVDPHWAGELPYTLRVASDGSVSTILGTVNFSDIRNSAKRRLGRSTNSTNRCVCYIRKSQVGRAPQDDSLARKSTRAAREQGNAADVRGRLPLRPSAVSHPRRLRARHKINARFGG